MQRQPAAFCNHLDGDQDGSGWNRDGSGWNRDGSWWSRDRSEWKRDDWGGTEMDGGRIEMDQGETETDWGGPLLLSAYLVSCPRQNFQPLATERLSGTCLTPPPTTLGKLSLLLSLQRDKV